MSGGRLTLDAVSLRFGGLTVLDSVDIEVAPGNMHAVIGPNGAGKSSLLNCVSGFYAADAGSIRVDGTELVGRRPDRIARLGVARVFQNVELFDGSDVRSNVLAGRHLLIRSGPVREMLGWPSARREEQHHADRVDEILDIVGLHDLAGHPVAALPYGAQKLVELARALAMEPRVLLLDEPVAGMSPTEKATVLEAVATVRDRLGVTVVLIEHDVELVLAHAELVTVIVSGCVLTTDTPEVVRRDQRVIDAYLGGEDRATERPDIATELVR